MFPGRINGPVDELILQCREDRFRHRIIVTAPGPPNPTATTDVIREPTGQLAALRRTGGSHYPITDALGSVIALTDAAGTKTDTFSYDPYGADTGRTGTTS